ncbi:MAG: cytochrome b/b6 domain-containing protein [Rugosibacter sp.]|nr:cytochrome b/b6 domain-containing protein [Rugosibacter sp.]
MPRIRVWDLPLRIFHWALAFCVIAAYISQSIGGNAMVWHSRFGLAVLGLVAFRLVWGFVGSTNARFRHFVRGPKTIVAYLRGQWSGPGHNPLGALSALVLLGVALLLTLTGLFANDDIAFEGPLYTLIDKDLSDRITKIHHWFEPVILILVSLHIAAIAFYVWVKKQPLVKPMMTGWKEVAEGESATGGGLGAFFFSLALAIAVVVAASGVWLTFI